MSKIAIINLQPNDLILDAYKSELNDVRGGESLVSTVRKVLIVLSGGCFEVGSGSGGGGGNISDHPAA
jgi:hypothetical protein